jgi:signal transduction histidine kinase/anti-sigma regulatory factor (Ser/Thr protein kinase)
MVNTDEQKILNLTKVVPLFVIAISLIAIALVAVKTRQSYQDAFDALNLEVVNEHKRQIEHEVERVERYIQNESLHQEDRILNSLRRRVQEAVITAEQIYRQNLGLSDEEIKHLIISTLSAIRFNDGKGYYFIYHMDGTSVMHPFIPSLEGENLWDLTDSKGNYVIRKLSSIASVYGEGESKWWWEKPESVDSLQHEKLGYVKRFSPYNWFIGTGEYVSDYEGQLKKDIIDYVSSIGFGLNGYVFIVDESGRELTVHHDRNANVFTDALDVETQALKQQSDFTGVSENGAYFRTSILDNNEQGALRQVFVKPFDKWHWIIGSELFLSQIDEAVVQEEEKLTLKLQSDFYQLLALSLFITTLFGLMSFLLAKKIRLRFESYRQKVLSKSVELRKLNNSLRKRVNERTQELQTSLDELKSTQSKLVESEKMAGLLGIVSGVAHELNTPLGVMTTGLSHLGSKADVFFDDLNNGKLSKADAVKQAETMTDCLKFLQHNLTKAANLVNQFKSLSIDLYSSAPKKFKFEDAVVEAIHLNRLSLQSKSIEVDYSGINSNLRLTHHYHSFVEIFDQLFQNSIAHAFRSDQKSKCICIGVKRVDSGLLVSYSDNGVGLTEDIENRIFEPFYTTKQRSECTGLGMAIVYSHLVHKLRGDVVSLCDSSEGFDIVFRIPPYRLVPNAKTSSS